MDSHNVGYALYSHGASRGGSVKDPGDTGKIKILPGQGRGLCEMRCGGSETRTLADPDAPDLELLLELVVDGGQIVITADTAVNASAHRTLTFTAVNQAMLLRSIQASAASSGSGPHVYRWMLVVADGAAAS